MSNQIILTRGLPASGKSTWAKNKVKKGKGDWVRVNLDNLRSMIHVDEWNLDNELLTVSVRNDIVKNFMMARKNIIVDDTNFNKIHFDVLSRIIEEGNFDYSIKYKEFDIDYRECIRRDLLRYDSVGKEVIMRMYEESKSE